jgi:hypothetical protein
MIWVAKEAEVEEMKHKLLSRSFLLSDLASLSYLALFKFLTQRLASSAYGYFRDELYYLAASQRLALGYVDYPLFIAWLTAFVRATLGDSLPALRFFPALAGALVVLLTGLMARTGRDGRASLSAASAAGTGAGLPLYQQLWRSGGVGVLWPRPPAQGYQRPQQLPWVGAAGL